MSETQTDQSPNGQIPAASLPDLPGATSWEAVLGIVTAIVGLGLILIGIDGATGGRVFGFMSNQASEPE